MHKKNLLLVLVLVLAMSFSGCLSFIFGGKPTTLEVTPNEVEIALDGETTVELKAVVENDKGEVMKVKETDIKWVIADVEEVEKTTENGDGEEEIGPVATLSKQTGAKVTVEGKRVGEATITVAYDDLSVTVPVVVIATKPADKTALEEAITTAQGLLETVVGEEPGQVSQEAKDALETAVTAATTVKDDADATQEDVDAAVTALNTAIDTFEAAIVPKPFIVFENFEGLTDVDEFWTADYKSLPGDENQPLYFATSGKTKMDLVDGKLKVGDARFSIGMPKGRTDTTSSDTEAGGTLDLSKPYRITIKFVEYGDTVTKKFSVFIDNNTSSDANSLHGKASRPYNVALESLPDNKTIVIEPTIGTENSFIQIRQESSSWIILDSIRIEYI